MTAYPNHAKRRLAAGKLAIGMVLRQARTVDTALVVKACGFDFFSIDLEHGACGLETASEIAAAALPVGVAALVRVPAQADHEAVRLLDAGAQGLIVPHVEDSATAQAAVNLAKFPSLGRRGAGVLPQLGFEGTAQGAGDALNAETLVVAMLETPAGITNAEAIAAIPGIDVLLIGTNDLCRALGIAGDFAHPRLEEAYRATIAATRKHGIHAGMTGLHEPALVRKFVSLGVRFVLAGTDLSFLMAAARERAAFLRNLGED